MSARRGVAALLAMMLGAALISVLPAAAAPGDAPPDSAKTVSGKGEFEKLQVTVSQTTDLINQVVTVSWKGGKQTPPNFSTNFLQIMQCWGDDPGPDRTQCQFGISGSSLGSGQVAKRALTNDNATDQKEKLTLPAGSAPSGQRYVPFWPVGRPQPTDAVRSNSNDFFDAQSTNEIPVARTRFDGTGQEFFEVQTLREAAGLGCGEQVVTGATAGRKCWLVVVPRGNTEVDGTPRTGTGPPSTFLMSSPLSQSNWANRIVFPLEFVPVGNACPIGAAERRVVGHELATDMVGRWQPALCAGSGGASFSYTQLADEVTRNQVLDGSSPGLALVTNPVPPDQAPSDRPLVYAPVGLSGLTIAFNIKHRPAIDAPPDKLQLEGQPFLSMKLTPRLVAKLLTQSYQDAVVGRQQHLTPEYLKNNPRNLLEDPEFLDLNPEYKDFTIGGPPPPADMLVQLGGSDLTSLLWSWVKADPDASEFLAGKPDKYGKMVINEKNGKLSLPTSTFPRQDQTCIDIYITTGVTPKSCTLDVHPFTNDMHDAGRSAARGDSQARVPAQDANNQVVPARVPRQGDGLMAVVDAATATRYGLPAASLRNAAGQFVTPTTQGLLAGETAMKPSAVPGVLAADPGAADPAAYPLTALSYAVASPSTLDAAAGKDYATFLRYAAGPGQKPGAGPGRLPLGMAPLPAALKAQTTTAAVTIEAQAGKVPHSPPGGPPTSPALVPRNPAGSTGGPNAAAVPTATATTPGAGANTPGGNVAPGGPAAKAPSVVQQPVARVGRTPALPAPAVGALLLVILISGALAATSSPVLQSSALRQVGAGVLRRLRRGVRPTEQ